jgi:hypothetical protein
MKQMAAMHAADGTNCEPSRLWARDNGRMREAAAAAMNRVDEAEQVRCLFIIF